MTTLSYRDHSRQFNQCAYIYPVVSRRCQGVSLGINLNLNNACNWRCIYCQVDGLIRGKPNSINLAQLEYELDGMLEWILTGDFMQRHVPSNLQRLNDICLSGNGESTLSPEFSQVCSIITNLRHKYQLTDNVKSLLITNGSEIHKPEVQAGLRILGAEHGEIWFKLDRATPEAISQVNQVQLNISAIINRLQLAASFCPTYVQSCWFKLNHVDPHPEESEAFINLILQLKPWIHGVLLYSTARNPALPEGQAISQVSLEFLEQIALPIRQAGIKVTAYP